jgi:hypothetical protein
LLGGDAWKEMPGFDHGLAVRLVADLRTHEGRIRDHIVFKEDRQIDKAARHADDVIDDAAAIQVRFAP